MAPTGPSSLIAMVKALRFGGAGKAEQIEGGLLRAQTRKMGGNVSMKNSRWLLGLLLGGLCAVASSGSYAQEKGGSDDFGPYKPVEGWFKPLREGYFERGLSVFFDSPNRIFFTSDVQF